MADDFDIVSDLNDGTADFSTPANNGDVPAHGADATHVNNPNPAPKTGDNGAKLIDDGDKPDADKPKSLRDQISSAIKAETDTPDAASQDGRVRNPDGTFAPKAAELPADPNAAPAAAPVAPPQGIDPAVFASLPAETQVTLARTMDEIAQSQQRFGTLANVEQLIAPRRDAWALNGMAPEQALGQLFALSDFATTKPQEFIQYFAEQNGIDLEELVLGLDPVDPVEKANNDRIAALERQLNENARMQQQAQHNARVDEVIAFASETGPDGKTLVRPYFGELGDAFATHVGLVKSENPKWTSAQILQQAYENACWAVPGVRSKMQDATRAASDAERLRASTDRASKAQTASASVEPGAPSQAPKAPNDPSLSLRDSIKASIAASGT